MYQDRVVSASQNIPTAAASTERVHDQPRLWLFYLSVYITLPTEFC